MIHSVIREDGVKVESMTKTEIESLVENKNIAENLINTLKEINAGKSLKVWAGNKNEFANAIQDKDVLYLVKDETFFTDLINRINSLENDVDLCEADITQLISQINSKYNEYVEKIQQLRDDYCKNPNVTINNYSTLHTSDVIIQFDMIPNYTNRTYTKSTGLQRLGTSMDNEKFQVSNYLSIDKETLNKWQNYEIEIKGQCYGMPATGKKVRVWEYNSYLNVNDFYFIENDSKLIWVIYDGQTQFIGYLYWELDIKITGQF